MVYVLRECGDWPRAEEVAAELIAEDRGVWVCEGLIGVIHALQGKHASARRLLASCHAAATQANHFHMTIDSVTGLARVAAAQGADDDAIAYARSLITLWERSEDHHAGVAALRWASGFFAQRGERECAHRCAEALTRMASTSGHADALAALAFAIGETALADGDVDAAAEQLRRSMDLHRDLDIPYERAEIGLRAGIAVAATGDRDGALELLGATYRTARKLGARPLATGGRGGAVARRVARPARGGRRRGRRPLPARARDRPARGRRPQQPGDRARALPQPPHGGLASAQPAAQARLPHAGRRSAPRARARPAHMTA